MFAPLQRGSIPVQGQDKEVINAAIVGRDNANAQVNADLVFRIRGLGCSSHPARSYQTKGIRR